MNARRRYLVTGVQGQVVQSLIERGSLSSDVEIIAVGRPELDLTDAETIRNVIEQTNPDVIISAAAYTAVDQAESDEANAVRVNSDGPAFIAKVAALKKRPLIQISTDYVFDGSKTTPYVEADPVAPLCAYGRSKLAAEKRIAEFHDNYAILRTAWVYSPFGKNFVKTMLRVANGREELSVVDDQVGNPTSALDIADGILKVASNLLDSKNSSKRGIFHMAGQGEASWADFAEVVFRISGEFGGPTAAVKRITTEEYPTPAKRPSNSRLDCRSIELEHSVKLPNWQTSTKHVVSRLVQTELA